MRLLLVVLLVLAPAPAFANVTPLPAPETPDPCTLCTIDPAVLQALIQACQTQPEGAACQILRNLAGIPIAA
jgi:hypothetical protein